MRPSGKRKPNKDPRPTGKEINDKNIANEFNIKIMRRRCMH